MKSKWTTWIKGMAAFGLALGVQQSSLGAPIRFAYIEFSPLSYAEKAHAEFGPGWLIEMFRGALSELKLESEFREYPLMRVADYLTRGEIDVYTCSTSIYKGAIQEKYLISKPLLSITASLYYMSTEPEIKSISDLNNKDLVAVLGVESFLKKLPASNKIVRAPDTKTAVTMLKEKRVSYLADYRERVEFQLRQLQTEKNLKSIDVASTSIYLCWSKSLPNAEASMNRFREAVIHYQDTPAGKAISAKYNYTGRFGDLALPSK